MILSPVAGLLLVLLGVPAVSAADSLITITVDVSSASVGVGTPPVWSITPYPNATELPQGTALQGHAECSQVFVSGDSGATEALTDASGNVQLPVGTYDFVDSSCTQDPAFPVSLTNTTGNYDIVFHGGSIAVTLTPTETHGYGTQTFDPSGTPTGATLEAVVITGDSQQLPVPVSFTFATTGGIQLTYPACASVTATSDGNGNDIATCRLGATDAANFHAGTGAWQASFGGNSTYLPSTYSGRLTGSTTPAQAAVNFQRQSTTVKLVPVQIPTNCNPLASTGDNGSLLAISVGELSCPELYALQGLTGVAFASFTVLNPASLAPYFDVVSEVLAESQYTYVLEVLAQNAARTATETGLTGLTP